MAIAPLALAVTLPLVRPLGFGARLGLATSVLIAVVCITQSWILARRHLADVRRYLTDRGQTISESLAREAGSSVLAGNVDALHQLAEQARSRAGVTYTRFIDGHGLLLASTGDVPAVQLPPPHASGHAVGPLEVSSDVWEFQTPILGGGTVAIGISLEPLQALRLQRFRTATLISSLFTIAAVLGALLLARAITQPLKTLANAADTIARGDLTTRVAVGGADEIGALARSFNAMVESVARGRTTLEEKVEELQTANRLKSEFLATVSHELRTPLNVIIGYAEMLADSPVSEEQAEMLRAIRRYSELQLDLVTNVLDFSRLSSGRISFHVERFALAPVLTEVLALYAGRIESGRVRLVASVDPRVPKLETDRIKLQEIVRNLVDNGVKFTEEGIVSVSARPVAEPGRVTIEVTDTGTGIASEDLASIFDAFHQLGESSTRRTGGVGLGLSIVKQLAEALGGSVSVTSRPGEGSSFRVDIPCRLPGLKTEPTPVAIAALDEVTRNIATLPRRARAGRATAITGRARSGK